MVQVSARVEGGCGRIFEFGSGGRAGLGLLFEKLDNRSAEDVVAIADDHVSCIRNVGKRGVRDHRHEASRGLKRNEVAGAATYEMHR